MTLDAATLRRLSALLDEALDLDEHARTAWLDGLTGEAEKLAPVLRDLLARRVTAGDALSRGPDLPGLAGGEGVDSAAFHAGETVGPYLLLREIASGGMGEVWLAERTDGQLKRSVALKLPTLGLRRTVLVQRFARERDILASLAHPNIARLYDAGLTDDGQPYLALEYVDGAPITRYCAEQRLDARRRVALLLQVMDAVQYAHANLVIHRDIKPSNVLVTDAGQAMLLDFGIAKLLQDERSPAQETELTRLAGRALTLDYAAPEQITGAPVSTATDVFALGVLLYELLAGRRPFEGDPRSIEAAVLTREPSRPKDVSPDLATIALKALKKDPAERYATVNAFADDLGRWLADEPVLARADSTWYRARKFVARNALAVGVAGAVGVIVLVAAGVSIRQAQVAREQTRIALAEAKTSEAVQGFLEGIFKANTGDQADPRAARERPARELLDEGAARIDQALDDVPAAKLRVLRTLADMYADMGLLDQSVNLYAKSAGLAQAVHGAGADAHLQALADLGHKLMDSDRFDEARAVIQRADALARARPDADPAVTAQIDLHLGTIHRRDDPRAALASAERAVEKLRRLPPSPILVGALHDYGTFLTDGGRNVDAVAALKEAVAAMPLLPAGGRGALPTVYSAWARATERLGDVAAADELYRQAISFSEANTGPASVQTLHVMGVHAQMLSRHGRLKRGVELAALARERASAWRESPDRNVMVPVLAGYEAQMRAAFGQPERALELADLGLRSFGSAERRPNRAVALHNAKARALLDLGRFSDSAAELDRAQDLIARHPMAPSYAAQNARIREQWLIARGEGARAIDAWRRHREAAGRPADPAADDAEAATDLAEALLASGEIRDAHARAGQALAAIARTTSRADVAEIEARALAIEGAALLKLGAPAEAIPALRGSVALHEAVYDATLSPAVARAQALLGAALLATGDRGGAREMLARAEAIRARHRDLGPQYVEPIRRLRATLAAPRPAGGQPIALR